MSDNEILDALDSDNALEQLDFDWVYANDEEMDNRNSKAKISSDRAAWRRIEEYFEMKELREQINDSISPLTPIGQH